MGRIFILKILSSIVLMHCSAICCSQSIPMSDSLRGQVMNLKQVYQGVLKSDPHLFNGIEYLEYNRNTEGHPFYLTSNWTDGFLNYSYQTYENVSLLYDILIDKVVIENPLSRNSIQLIDENIRGFSLGERKFIRIKESDSIHLPKGYYELLYSGKTKVLVKRKKTILEKASIGDYRITLNEFSRIYILTSKLPVEVSSKKKLRSVLKNKKKEVNQFIRKNNLNFRGNFENALVATLIFYDGLKSQ